MVVDPVAAERALMRYYNTTSAKQTGKKQVGPLWEPLAMVRARFSVIDEPFLQVKLNAACALPVRPLSVLRWYSRDRRSSDEP